MSIETVMQIARQLHAEGKQPSVALIKARLPAPCPMPDVITGIQRWRQQATSNAGEEQPIAAARPLNPEQSVDPLQVEIQQLRDEVSQLREEVVMLRRSIRIMTERFE
ncbi:hypothetical protein [Pseudaeromonas pectinilytica]|jgi:predicted RNase H-like nuclease (RuvC/YqgF family)